MARESLSAIELRAEKLAKKATPAELLTLAQAVSCVRFGPQGGAWSSHHFDRDAPRDRPGFR